MARGVGESLARLDAVLLEMSTDTGKEDMP
jgi:hypothetical protein